MIRCDTALRQRIKAAAVSGFTHSASAPAYNRRLIVTGTRTFMTAAPDRSASVAALQPAEWGIPTRWGATLFRAKTVFHQLRRGIRDLRAGPQFLSKSNDHGFSFTIGGSPTPFC